MVRQLAPQEDPPESADERYSEQGPLFDSPLAADRPAFVDPHRRGAQETDNQQPEREGLDKRIGETVQ